MPDTEDEIYEKKMAEVEGRLRPRLTPDFLDTLVESAKVVGWSADFIEVKSFLLEVFNIVGKKPPLAYQSELDKLEPYDFEAQ